MKAVVIAALLIAATPALADPRVRTVTYAPTEVVSVVGHYGYQMLIALDAGERIENISIGDSVAWAVTPNKSANGLFLKPVEPDAATNMTVQTNARTYLFELRAARASRGGATPGMTYKLQFRYPQTESRLALVPAMPTPKNRAYRLSGPASLRPAEVFDDGRATYFRWPAGASVPAIFLVEGRREELVNHGARDGYLVVDRVARAYVLRAGRNKVRVKNIGFGEPPAAPGEGGA